MGLFRPLVGRAQTLNTNPEQRVVPSKRLLTPATAVSAARPIIGAGIALKLIRGERYVTKELLGMGLTDAVDGWTARLLDKCVPELHIGTSELGALADWTADSTALIEVSFAALAAPRVSLAGKLAVGTILAKEGVKGQWALRSARNYRNLTRSEESPKGERLNIPVNMLAKEAMVEAFGALILACATNDVDPGPLRTTLGICALGMAGSSLYHGEQSRALYKTDLAQMMAEVTTAAA